MQKLAVTKVDALTGLRFLAASAIVLTHSQTGYFLPVEGGNSGLFRPFALGGAVPLFFVLSGFVLTLNADKYRSKSDFFVARFARIWPGHICALFFLFLTCWPYTPALWADAPSRLRLLLNVAMVHAWPPSLDFNWSLNAPSWSISVEMFFYAAFPFLLPFLQVASRVRAALLIGAIIVAMVLIGWIAPKTDPLWLTFNNPVVNLPAFMIGMLTAMHLRKQDGHPKGGWIQLLAFAGLVAANGICAYWAPRVIPGTLGKYLSSAGAIPAYAFVIYALARYSGPISQFLSNRVMVFLGDISFTLYLFHQIIIRWHSGLYKSWPFPLWEQYVMFWAACIAISAAVHYGLERPARAGIVWGWKALKKAALIPERQTAPAPAFDRERLRA